jgi:hypothetical protein
MPRKALKLAVPVIAASPFLVLPLILSNSPHPPISAPRATHNPRYASQSGSTAATRKAQIIESEDENYDAAFETCLAWGLNAMARNEGVRRDPFIVARTFADGGWTKAFRKAPYDGCLRALRFHGK